MPAPWRSGSRGNVRTRRPAKVFIDGARNDDHKTTICVYSLRAKDQPTVSTPLKWAEVEKAVKSGRAADLVVGAKDIITRATRSGDLFARVLTLKQKLPRPGAFD